ncbi:hypothetical protein [Pseudomonas sp. BN515]|uniref:hypothetical protein n=1 Tax=Pseudomonas sp. BN515 TaxID=2567892 RepID=UPI0024541F3B|nr:hypothetical protein [Pseudomonas sp. BN515]
MLALSADLLPETIGQRWVGIRTKESADVRAAAGLRVAALVEVRARFSPCFVPGRYLIHGGRLFHITSVRDFRGDRAELVMSCEEMVGFRGEARREGMMSRECQVFLRHDVPYRSDHEQDVVLRTYAEVALIEAGRVEADDQLLVEGELYNVMALAKDADDGVVRGLWLERVE